MRGDVERTEDLFSYVALADRVPSDHPLRSIRALIRFCACRPVDAIYAKTGRPCPAGAVAEEVLYTVRSERMLCQSTTCSSGGSSG